MDSLIDNINNLKLESKENVNYKNVLYYEVVFSPETYQEIITMVLEKTNMLDSYNKEDNIITTDETTYHINKEFHITMLYTGGKENELAQQFIDYLDKEVDVTVDRIGINEKFICLGVSIDNSVPYHGNKVVHITVGLCKKLKAQAKDSYMALSSNNVIILDQPMKIKGVLKQHMK